MQDACSGGGEGRAGRCRVYVAHTQRHCFPEVPMPEIPTRVLMLLVVTFVILVTGATWAIVRSTATPVSEAEGCTGGGDSPANLQDALDEVLGVYPRWERSADGSWRRDYLDERAENQEVYRVEEDSFIALRANSAGDGADESRWLVVTTWCSATEFLDAAPAPPKDADPPTEGDRDPVGAGR